MDFEEVAKAALEIGLCALGAINLNTVVQEIKDVGAAKTELKLDQITQQEYDKRLKDAGFSITFGTIGAAAGFAGAAAYRKKRKENEF